MYTSISIINKLRSAPYRVCLLAGMLSGFVFAPFFLFPLIFSFALFAYHAQKSCNYWQAFKVGLCFGWGHFLVGLYWISMAPYVSDERLWWAVPIACFGIPAVLSLFTASISCLAYTFRDFRLFNFIFVFFWVLAEWLRCWIFTGFPWNLLGYSLSFCLELCQCASIFGTLGLSAIVAYVAIAPIHLLNDQKTLFKRHVLICTIILSAMYCGGKLRLNSAPTEFTPILARLVQPSIEHHAKWDQEKFADVLATHINLSIIDSKNKADLIIWPESALPSVITDQYLVDLIAKYLHKNQLLITGATGQSSDAKDLYVGMYGINSEGKIVLEYNKTHLVPFGEYIPFKFLPIKKITHGLSDYTPGNIDQEVYLKSLNLKINALLCYEVIFPEEVRRKSIDQDLIINITYDTWFGSSPGLHQHFHAARLRAIENGIPLLRVANNGISAIIDCLGRILQQTQINDKTYLEGYIPKKNSHRTIWSQDSTLAIALLFLALLILEAHKLK